MIDPITPYPASFYHGLPYMDNMSRQYSSLFGMTVGSIGSTTLNISINQIYKMLQVQATHFTNQIEKLEEKVRNAQHLISPYFDIVQYELNSKDGGINSSNLFHCDLAKAKEFDISLNLNYQHLVTATNISQDEDGSMSPERSSNLQLDKAQMQSLDQKDEEEKFSIFERYFTSHPELSISYRLDFLSTVIKFADFSNDLTPARAGEYLISLVQIRRLSILNIKKYLDHLKLFFKEICGFEKEAYDHLNIHDLLKIRNSETNTKSTEIVTETYATLMKHGKYEEALFLYLTF